jgi:hypothetical protein
VPGINSFPTLLRALKLTRICGMPARAPALNATFWASAWLVIHGRCNIDVRVIPVTS